MSVAVPSLNWLRVFEAAARCESFARAATQLNMSPAAVSQQVRALEERLGVALFEYAKNDDLYRTIYSRIKELTKVGFKPEDIVVVSCRGMQSTALASVEKFGKHSVRRFTGEYDVNDEQIYTVTINTNGALIQTSAISSIAATH